MVVVSLVGTGKVGIGVVTLNSVLEDITTSIVDVGAIVVADTKVVAGDVIEVSNDVLARLNTGVESIV